MIRFGTIISVNSFTVGKVGISDKEREINRRLAEKIASNLTAPINHVVDHSDNGSYIYTNTEQTHHLNRFVEIQAMHKVCSDQQFLDANRIKLYSTPSPVNIALDRLRSGCDYLRIHLQFCITPESK